MKDNRIRILSTRPLDGAFVEKAALHNITFDTLTFIEIKPRLTDDARRLISELGQQKATIVFTSMNAVEVVVDALPKEEVMPMPDWKIYCLGGASFTLVKKYWAYERICATAKNATELAEVIASDGVMEVTFFCGNLRREELPELLHSRGVKVNEVVVYETLETPAKVDVPYNGILFFSPSAVNSYFSCNSVGEGTVLFAIGDTTAKTIKQFCSNDIIVSDFPAKDQLADKAIEYFAAIGVGEK